VRDDLGRSAERVRTCAQIVDSGHQSGASPPADVIAESAGRLAVCGLRVLMMPGDDVLMMPSARRIEVFTGARRPPVEHRGQGPDRGGEL
jgi:hypothetical protein